MPSETMEHWCLTAVQLATTTQIGGAINNYNGSLFLSGCSFSNNYTTASNARYGGAIGVNGGSEIRIVNCTFSGNKYNTNGGASDLGVYSNSSNYTIAGCTGITIQSSTTITTYDYGLPRQQVMRSHW